MSDNHHFTRVNFYRFKALRKFTLNVHHFNILVGPNNSGKSTILAAFRVLAAAMRRARSRKPQLIPGPQGETFGYVVDLGGASVAEENIFYNYDDDEPASVHFTLSTRIIHQQHDFFRGAAPFCSVNRGYQEPRRTERR